MTVGSGSDVWGVGVAGAAVGDRSGVWGVGVMGLVVGDWLIGVGTFPAGEVVSDPQAEATQMATIMATPTVHRRLIFWSRLFSCVVIMRMLTRYNVTGYGWVWKGLLFLSENLVAAV